MDASRFAEFLKAELQKNVDVFSNNIINVAYDKIENMHRAAGACDILKQLVSGMEDFVKAYVDKENNLNSGGSIDSSN